jgi:hypothetical protein
MSDPTNGTVAGAAARVSQSLIGALPPAFIMLCLVNAIFIASLLYFIDDQLDTRTKMVQAIVERCMDKTP